MKKVYNKLIRDKIPKIIENAGKDFKVETLNDKDYLASLIKKLQEELDEFSESEEIKELADLVEVIYAILEFKGVSLNEFEEIRLDKKNKRGGFEEKLFLVSVEK
ncbi:MAG: phosphoribosyl-ATP pyrophosphohydrolase [bacterium]